MDDVLAARFAVPVADLAALRKERATSPEVILSRCSPRLRVRSAEVLARFRAGKVSWGMLLEQAGLKPKEIDALVRRSMR